MVYPFLKIVVIHLQQWFSSKCYSKIKCFYNSELIFKNYFYILIKFKVKGQIMRKEFWPFYFRKQSKWYSNLTWKYFKDNISHLNKSGAKRGISEHTTDYSIKLSTSLKNVEMWSSTPPCQAFFLKMQTDKIESPFSWSLGD